MNWFKRYGIPGVYFYGLTFGLLHALYPCVINADNISVLFAIATVTFLPIGYIITIFQCSLYLKCRCKGLLIKAKNKAGNKIPSLLCECNDDEAMLEARWAFITSNKIINTDPPDRIKHMQDWSRKRMDIITINRSIFWATIFSLFIILIILITRCSAGWKCQFGVEAILLLLFSVLIIILMLYMAKILGGQIVELLVLMFHEYGNKEERID